MYFGFDPAKFTLNSPIFTGAPTSPTPPLHNNTDRIATMAALRSELLALGDAEYDAIFGKSLSGNGYQKLPSGLIAQWGTTASVASPSTTIVTYPIAFPNAVIGGVASLKRVSDGSGVGAAYFSSNSNTQGTIVHDDSSTGTPASAIFYMIWGY